MASFPQFYSNYSIFPSDFTEFSTQANIMNNYSVIENRMCSTHQDSSSIIPMPDDHVVSLDYYCDTTVSSCGVPIPSNFSEQPWSVPEFVMPPAIPSSKCKVGLYGGINGVGGNFQNMNGGFGEECCGFVEDIKPPPYPNIAKENWGSYHQGNQMAAVEEPNNIKVGRYSEEERKERILRYLKKRNQRNFNKTIKYACRKTLADRRVRVRGRFARNNELCDDEMTMKKNDNIPHKQDLYAAHSIQFQLKNDDDEEDWLQEAMASLVYLSHSSPEDV